MEPARSLEREALTEKLTDRHKKEIESGRKSLHEIIWEMIHRYLSSFSGTGDIPKDVYKLVMEEAEQALYLAVMQHANDNQSLAAKIVGKSRGTLRTKLKRYFGTTHVSAYWRRRED